MLSQEDFDIKPKVKSRLNILPENPQLEEEESSVGLGRFPSWLHRRLPKGGNLWLTDGVMRENRLHTVCEEAKCPNLLECWSKKTATFLVMGKQCTRACGFCDIAFSKEPPPLEDSEPQRVAESVRQLGLKHAVITMVARDDLPDGGAEHLAAVVKAIRQLNPATSIELLTSDFAGNQAAWQTMLAVKPEIFNYNIETVHRLSPSVRHTATYERTLEFLSFAKTTQLPGFVKSGMMVGLGETKEEVFATITDLKNAGCDIITIGQYLQPNRRKLLVKRFVTPEEFEAYAQFGKTIGVKQLYSGPFVRSSYHAGEAFTEVSK